MSYIWFPGRWYDDMANDRDLDCVLNFVLVSVDRFRASFRSRHIGFLLWLYRAFCTCVMILQYLITTTGILHIGVPYLIPGIVYKGAQRSTSTWYL